MKNIILNNKKQQFYNFKYMYRKIYGDLKHFLLISLQSKFSKLLHMLHQFLYATRQFLKRFINFLEYCFFSNFFYPMLYESKGCSM